MLVPLLRSRLFVPAATHTVTVIIRIHAESLAAPEAFIQTPSGAVGAIVIARNPTHNVKHETLECVFLLAVPVGMDYESEVALGELAVAILEELAGVGRDSVAGYWHIGKLALADDCAFAVKP